MSTFKMNGSDTEFQLGSDGIQNQLEITREYIERHLQSYIAPWDEFSDNNHPSSVYEFRALRVYGSGSTQYINHFMSDSIMVGDNAKDTNPNIAFTLKYQYIGNYNTYNTIVSGRKAGINIIANGTSGKVVNTVGKLSFDGSILTTGTPMGGIENAHQIGDWQIYNGDGDSEINTTYGHNTIVAGDGNNIICIPHINALAYDFFSYSTYKGANDITLGDGNNKIISSSGWNNIVVGNGNNDIDIKPATGNGFAPDGFNYHISTGDGSNNINIAQEASILNLGNGYNKVTLNYISSASGPERNDNYCVINSGTGQLDLSVTETAAAVTITAAGSTNINTNTYSSNIVLNASGEDNLFTAGIGNSTLNAAYSSGAIDVSAVDDKNSTFIAITGAGDDTLTAGHGQSTFTGGLGDNLFAFTKGDAEGGSTVITDFSASDGNQIALFGYGLNRTALKQLLSTSQNDAQGNAVLDLGTNNITLQDVSVSDLNVNQFFVYK